MVREGQGHRSQSLSPAGRTPQDGERGAGAPLPVSFPFTQAKGFKALNVTLAPYGMCWRERSGLALVMLCIHALPWQALAYSSVSFTWPSLFERPAPSPLPRMSGPHASDRVDLHPGCLAAGEPTTRFPQPFVVFLEKVQKRSILRGRGLINPEPRPAFCALSGPSLMTP